MDFIFHVMQIPQTNDYAIHIDIQKGGQTVKLSSRYKNALPDPQHQIIMDISDLRKFGQFCIGLAEAIKDPANS